MRTAVEKKGNGCGPAVDRRGVNLAGVDMWERGVDGDRPWMRRVLFLKYKLNMSVNRHFTTLQEKC